MVTPEDRLSHLSFDFAVGGLIAQGWSRERAEAEVKRQLPHLTPPAPVVRDENALEKAEQLEVRKIAMAYGFTISNLSQARASKQTPGIPDLWMTHKREPIALWWETKRKVGGVFTPAQIDFRDDCIRCGVGYGSGDRYAFVEKLIDLELAVRGSGQYGIDPVRLA